MKPSRAEFHVTSLFITIYISRIINCGYINISISFVSAKENMEIQSRNSILYILGTPYVSLFLRKLN